MFALNPTARARLLQVLNKACTLSMLWAEAPFLFKFINKQKQIKNAEPK
jgi:hypothetical protein